MKVLITGGAGFIGSHLAERLLKDGHEVFVFDDLSTGDLDNVHHLEGNPKFHMKVGSVLDRDALEPLFAEADLVYHLAAAVGVNYVIENPLQSLTTNIRGTEIVLELANRKKTRVLIASTSEVAGKKNGKVMFSEDDDRLLGPTTVTRWNYSTSKAVDEMLGLAYWREKKLPVVIVRFFNVIGPRQSPNYGMVVPRFIKQALLGHPITVYNDGEQKRCFTDIEDAVDGLLALGEHPEAPGEIFNLGGDADTNEISIKSLAGKIKNLTESDSPVEYVPYEKAFAKGSYEDLNYRVPDLTKINSFTGYEPSVSLDMTLRKIIEYYES
ncbi:MAG: nucleoside-diphosphate sugar epimerase [Gemmatimonadetes bacterium]|nr:nucleoside-diphosphate sugar epimerase [Gemmatimonadota bacterium]|tara:strand:+ start:72 stop:1046 length:975 start_codon:yes stop_codon:yes gene_type:complete